MSEFLLILYKPGQRSNTQYWALGGDQHPSITLGQGSIDDLTPIARGKKVTVLIDAHFTTLESVTVPSKNRNKQMQAIPFAMEDYLAEDIDDTYFALGKSEADNKVPVIAIKRSLLEDTLEIFNKQNIHLDALTADSVALPGDKNKWCVLIDDDSALIKTGDSQAHSCDRDNLAVILQALLEQSQHKPESITYYYQAQDTDAELMLDSIEMTIEKHTYQNNALEIFVQHLSNVQSLNLLQGEFSPKRQTDNTWLNPWKAVAAVASLWIILYLTHTSILSSQLEKQNIELSHKIETEFKRAVPDARKMTNMRKRVERRLGDLKAGGNSSNSSFLNILSKAAPILSSNKKIEIKAAVFRNNYIDVDLSAKTLQDIEQIKSKLSTVNGINTVLSTTVEKDKVIGRLRLEARG